MKPLPLHEGLASFILTYNLLTPHGNLYILKEGNELGDGEGVKDKIWEDEFCLEY